jgi:hypothetical protein
MAPKRDRDNQKSNYGVKQLAKRCNADDIQKDDALYRLSYMTVVHKGNNYIEVRNSDGKEWGIDINIVENECFNAAEMREEKKVTRTELVNILTNAGDQVMTITFRCQPKKEVIERCMKRLRQAQDIVSEGKNPEAVLKIGYEKDPLDDDSFDDVVKGRKVVIQGRIHRAETEFGRTRMIEMLPNGEEKFTLVDHRGLEELTLKGIHYHI